MDAEEIKKKLAEFAATLKPAEPPVHVPGGTLPIPKKAPKSVTKKPPPVPVEEESEPVAAGTAACFHHEFVHMVGVLPQDYIGSLGTKTTLMDFMTQVIGECPKES